MKHSVTVGVAYFHFEENGRRSFANQRFKDACLIVIDIKYLENDKDYKLNFQLLSKIISK